MHLNVKDVIQPAILIEFALLDAQFTLFSTITTNISKKRLTSLIQSGTIGV